MLGMTNDRMGTTAGPRGMPEERPRLRRNVFAPLMALLAPLSACGDASPTGVTADTGHAAPAEALYPSPGGVADLAVSFADESSVQLTWTQVDDGTGTPARYRLKYAPPSIVWRTALTGCEPAVGNGRVGASVSCTVEDLDAGADYEFLLMSYRVEDGAWVDAKYSNIASGRTAEGVDGAPGTTSGEAGGPRGMWIDPDEILGLPTSGAAWERVLADASRDPGTASIADQDSNHDVYTMAAALVCVRTGEYCGKARRGLLDAVGTEQGGRWLAVGRNLAAYMIAADLLDLRADGDPNSDGTRFHTWADGWLTRRLSDNNTATELRPFAPFHSAANAAAQEGLAYLAVAAYLRDDWAMERGWDAFRTYACDPTAPDREGIDLERPVTDGWTHDDARPCAVNPAGATKQVPTGRPGAGSVHRIDGALVGDMRRGGAYKWAPGYTQYVWVGLEGFVPAAVILERAGYPAFQVADRAVLHTHEYLMYLRASTGDRRWFDGDRARDIVHLVNRAYDATFPMNGVAGGGRTVGYTSWTHR